MNVRILRLCDIGPVGRVRHVAGLGQMQPVLFGIERGRQPTLRIEGVVGDRPCWHVLPLPRYKAQAKTAFAELERCNTDGTRSAASQAWEIRRHITTGLPS